MSYLKPNQLYILKGCTTTCMPNLAEASLSNDPCCSSDNHKTVILMIIKAKVENDIIFTWYWWNL